MLQSYPTYDSRKLGVDCHTSPEVIGQAGLILLGPAFLPVSKLDSRAQGGRHCHVAVRAMGMRQRTGRVSTAGEIYAAPRENLAQLILAICGGYVL